MSSSLIARPPMLMGRLLLFENWICLVSLCYLSSLNCLNKYLAKENGGYM